MIPLDVAASPLDTGGGMSWVLMVVAVLVLVVIAVAVVLIVRAAKRRTQPPLPGDSPTQSEQNPLQPQ